MPKSRNRKGHNKKVAARRDKIKSDQNKFKKELLESFKRQQQEQINEELKKNSEEKVQEVETPIDKDFVID